MDQEKLCRTPEQVLGFMNHLKCQAEIIGFRDDDKEAVWLTMLDGLSQRTSTDSWYYGWPPDRYQAIRHCVQQGLDTFPQNPTEQDSLPSFTTAWRIRSLLKKMETTHQALFFQLLGYSPEEAEEIVDQLGFANLTKRLKDNTTDIVLAGAKIALLDNLALIGAALCANNPTVAQWFAENKTQSIGGVAASFLLYIAALEIFSARPDGELLRLYRTCPTPFSVLMFKLYEVVDPKIAQEKAMSISRKGTFGEAIFYEVLVGGTIFSLGSLFGKGAAAVAGSNIFVTGGLMLRAGLQIATNKAVEKLQKSNISSKKQLVEALLEWTREKKQAVLAKLNPPNDLY